MAKLAPVLGDETPKLTNISGRGSSPAQALHISQPPPDIDIWRTEWLSWREFSTVNKKGIDMYIIVGVFTPVVIERSRRTPMNPRGISPPWDYLKQASLPSLQSFELSRLNHAANIRKQMDVLLDEYLEECSAAMVARYLLDRVAHDASLPHELGRNSLPGESEGPTNSHPGPHDR
jgi:hypothetical protein